MITKEETFDFINELENTFKGRTPVDTNDEESVDLYYMNRLFQHDMVFRLYILTAFCLYMDTAMNENQQPVSMDERIKLRIKHMHTMISQVTSKDVLQRILLHSAFAAERLAPDQKYATIEGFADKDS